MHSLNRILVNVKLLGDTTNMNHDEVINKVRNFAEYETKCFYGVVYEWRETETAGRWQSEYPENVLLGSEDPERLLKEIAYCEASQKEKLGNNLNALGKYASMTLNDIKVKYDEKGSAYMAVYHIKNLAKLLSGEYFYDSLFYNTYEHTAKIDYGTRKKIQENPKDWAIVLFDHYF